VEAQLVELLSKFDFQSVPSVLFNQILFDKDYEGLGRIQTVRLLEDEQERVRLPLITMVSDLGSAETAGCYCRMFHASGFEGGVYSAANEVIWLIALIVSKEPADLSAIDAITQRLDMAFRGRTRHAISGLQERNVNTRAGASLKAIRWYISKEGFSKSAGDRISAAAGYHSTFTQLDLAHDHILSVVSESRSTEGTAFELVIPIEDDAELIAARTVEQIARTGDFDQESINQIKTALIEACLNAAEHSDSPDRKIYQKFILANDRLVITVSSKGKQFSASATEGALAGSPKRGRGLQIIKALMDEVRFEQTDDGSSLVMAKLLKRPESQL
ncbi:MAG TPA: ATP-binding protein, partial [Blastocatellia bacterium]|nr:ATP-binding protein [Blastocatellia bacterium]